MLAPIALELPKKLGENSFHPVIVAAYRSLPRDDYVMQLLLLGEHTKNEKGMITDAHPVFGVRVRTERGNARYDLGTIKELTSTKERASGPVGRHKSSILEFPYANGVQYVTRPRRDEIFAFGCMPALPYFVINNSRFDSIASLTEKLIELETREQHGALRPDEDRREEFQGELFPLLQKLTTRGLRVKEKSYVAVNRDRPEQFLRYMVRDNYPSALPLSHENKSIT